jgi:hypothetical protein
MVVDQYTDPQHRLLFQLKREFPREVLRAKTASLDGTGTPATAFADFDSQLFPVHSPEQALLSKVYATKQAHMVQADVMARIDKALDLYGVEWAERPTATKEASDDTSHYLLPQHQALLVKEAAHVEPVAQALMAQRYKLTMPSMMQAATGLVKKAAALGMNQKDLPIDVYKYAGLTTCDVGVLADWVEARAVAAPTTELRADYTKVASYIATRIPADGVIRDRADLIKIAGILERLDNEAHLSARYGRTLLDPIETVFNMDKVAEQMVTLAGNQVALSKLQAIPQELLEEVLGPDVMQHVQAEGATDPAQFAAMIQTLPADLQTVLYNSTKAYL